jgi:trehalose 6-phosphate phosphatase
MPKKTPPVIDCRSDALLLDIDGTLLDIAATPDSVHVPPELHEVLQALSRKTDGALALVTGRGLDDVDRLFPEGFAAVACHGAQIRRTPGSPVEILTPPIPQYLCEAVHAIATLPGTFVEDKTYSLTLHYRLAHDPTPILAQAQALEEQILGTRWVMVHAKAAVELKSATIDKGLGIRALLQAPPFFGRRPIFGGDDVIDEPALRTVAALGGLGIAVGRAMDGATHLFQSPTEVRGWLKTAANIGFE